MLTYMELFMISWHKTPKTGWGHDSDHSSSPRTKLKFRAIHPKLIQDSEHPRAKPTHVTNEHSLMNNEYVN